MSPRDVIESALRGVRRPGGSALAEPVGRSLQVRVPGPDDQPPVGAGGRVEPLMGPLMIRPVGMPRRQAAAMLLTAVEGLPVGPADEALLARATDVMDPADVAVWASLLERARIEGPSVWASPVAASAPVEGWVTVCKDCDLPAITGPVSMDEAESLARTHDRIHHHGAWTCEVLPVRAAGGVR